MSAATTGLAVCSARAASGHAAAAPSSAASFDHHVGAREQRRRDLKAERPGRLQVDDELEFRRLQDRQVGGLGALEDLTGVGAELTIHATDILLDFNDGAGLFFFLAFSLWAPA